jgi:hypothetical protein
VTITITVGATGHDPMPVVYETSPGDESSEALLTKQLDLIRQLIEMIAFHHVETIYQVWQVLGQTIREH